MAARDGSFSFDFEGVYDDVQEHKRIAYTMSDGRTCEIIFSPENGAPAWWSRSMPKRKTPWRCNGMAGRRS